MQDIQDDLVLDSDSQKKLIHKSSSFKVQVCTM